MKTLKKGTMPDGTEILLVDYENGRGVAIHAYPFAKNCSLNKWIVAGEKFTLVIAENKYRNYFAEQVRADFNALQTGEKQLADLRPYFWNGEKDTYLLGLD